jgi:hypothetical protein
MTKVKKMAKRAAEPFYNLFLRWRYPFSLPEDICIPLGIEAQRSVDFAEFMHLLTTPQGCPRYLRRFMPRDKAEALFMNAKKKERFKNESLYSFYFGHTWVEFVLQFDVESRLRRVYMHNKDLKDDGLEIRILN